nr:hypothetical protein BaRGS_033725 [Batillaria attramentaria]
MRGRKLRKGRRGSGANFQAPPSPARSDTSSVGGKRKARPNEDTESLRGDKGTLGSSNKRSRSCSRGVPVPDDDKEEEEDMDTDTPKDSKKDSSSSESKDSNKREHLSERAERMKAKELRQLSVTSKKKDGGPTMSVGMSVTKTSASGTGVIRSQVSPSLKMIQPKPTIMGEYSNVNPALADLKEKRSKSKKKNG